MLLRLAIRIPRLRDRLQQPARNGQLQEVLGNYRQQAIERRIWLRDHNRLQPVRIRGKEQQALCQAIHV